VVGWEVALQTKVMMAMTIVTTVLVVVTVVMSLLSTTLLGNGLPTT
jgi:hypothetical protein